MEKKEKFIGEDAVCSPSELCERFPVFTPQNLCKMREKKCGPSYYKVGSRYFYSIQSAEDYIKASFNQH